jgi:hypothetical protein
MMKRLAVVVILCATVLIVPAYVYAGVSWLTPQPGFGITCNPRDGRVIAVTPGGPGARAGVRLGDHVLDLARGDVRRGYRLNHPQIGDTLRVATPRGIVTVTTAPVRLEQAEANAVLLGQMAGVVVIVLATLLFFRRPGSMALGFWLYAIGSINVGTLDPLVERLPSSVELPVWLALLGFGCSFAVPLIPFALRFPRGTLSPRWRRSEVAAWGAFGLVWILGLWFARLLEAGELTQWQITLVESGVADVPLLVAAVILAWRYARSPATERAQTAWALTGFGLMIGGELGAAATYAAFNFGWLDVGTMVVAFNLGIVVAGLAPLLAIYPILRYRLFDLGFVVNRAALYSLLTVAALATLAGVNWFAQHFVTERLALVLQPIAAIAIGLGYLRVRGAVQTLLERTIFRDRFAAELELEGTIKGFALAERAGAIDESLTEEVASVLRLRTAAVFRVAGTALTRVASTGWDGASLDTLQRDDRLVRRLLADTATLAIDPARWNPNGLPPAPNEPVLALALTRGSVLVGIALYGRHRNGTEIDPEEKRLLRRLCDAAASAYRNAELQSEVSQLRGRLAVLESQLVI